jgi:hypothetical protein
MISKTLSAIAVVTALVSPVFAQDKSAPERPTHALRHYRSSFNQVQEPASGPRLPATGASIDRGYDPSRIGGHDADFNPSN